MTISEDHVRLLLGTQVDDDTVVWFIANLREFSEIMQARDAIAKDENLEIIRHRRVKADLASRRVKLTAECPHNRMPALLERHSDPAGGSDSSTSCSVCGGIW